MTEPSQHHDSPPPIRRVTARDRKARIEAGALFPPQETHETQPLQPVTDPDPTEADTRTAARRPARPPAPRARLARPRRTHWRANLATAFFLLASAGMIAYFALVWHNPFSPLNPLAPPTPLPIFVTATPPGALAPPAAPPTATRPPRLVAADVTYEPFDGDAACDWSGIVGRVLTVEATLVQVAGAGVDLTVATGARGDYVVQVGSAPRRARFTVTVINTAGDPLADPVTVETGDTCDDNAARLDFTLER